MWVAFLKTDTVIESSSCLVIFVSRKAMEPSDSISMVNLILVLIELRCEWNSSRALHRHRTGRALHQHRRGRGLESRSEPEIFFQVFVQVVLRPHLH